MHTTRVGVGSFDAEQFYPNNLVISEGDSVTFTNKNEYEPHFLAFPTSPADQGKFFGPHGPDLMPGQTTTFSFPKAGTDHCVCYLHDGNKMEGDITVQPKGYVHAYVGGPSSGRSTRRRKVA